MRSRSLKARVIPNCLLMFVGAVLLGSCDVAEAGSRSFGLVTPATAQVPAFLRVGLAIEFRVPGMTPLSAEVLEIDYSSNWILVDGGAPLNGQAWINTAQVWAVEVP